LNGKSVLRIILKNISFRTSLFFLLQFLFFYNGVLQAQWVSKKDTLQFSVQSVAHSIDATSTGFAIIAVNPGTMNKTSALYITEDYGLAWSEIPLPSGQYVVDVAIGDSINIWITTGSGEIYKTTDKGGSWKEQFYDTTKTKFMNYIKMFDENNGIAMGDAVDDQPALFIKTNNGGTTWNIINNNLNGYISADEWRRIDFVDMNNGYFSWGNNNLIKTTDGGSTWNKTNFLGDPWIIKFYNQNLGLAFSTDWTTFKDNFKKTTNGGATWEEYQVDIEGWGSDIEFLPGKPACVWFTGQYGLYFSIDTGKTWLKYNLNVDELGGRDIVFTDENQGWLLCDNGNIFYTDNNGQIIVGVKENNSNKTPTSFALYQNYPNPFNPNTKISYTIPIASNIRIIVYNSLGQTVKVLENGFKIAGNYSINFDASNLPSGIYLYKLEAGQFSQVKKMSLIK
jgi:photosystem II stability/assembly factor-like uncharacterized protein